MARTPSISIIERPKQQMSLPDVTHSLIRWSRFAGLRPRMTCKRCFKTSQQILSQHLQLPSFSGLSRESCANWHLCNNKANLLTRLVPCCNKILGTGPRMTGARIACFVPSASFVLCLLFFNMSFFLKKLAKTSVGTENIPLIRHLGFAERERETFA